MSRFSDTSGLTMLNRSAGTGQAMVVDRRLERALLTAERARRITKGRFDPRVAADLEALGEHGADLGPFVDDGPRRPWLCRPILCRDRAGRMTIERPIDLGGIGKGLALRWAAAAIDAAGIGDYLLDAGGDIVLRGRAPGGGPWQIGIEDPAGGSTPIAVIVPPAGAVATSSIRRRAWTVSGRRVHHLLDPRTGEPASGLRSVTVSGSDPAWAEIWSKALFVGGREGIGKEARRGGVAAWWVADEDALEMTPAARAMTCWVAATAD